MVTFFYFTAIFMFLILSVILCGVIMMQESKNSGLGASFGGGDASDSLFGTSTADVLKKFTAYLAFAFMIACIALSFWTEGMERTRASSVPASVIEQAE